MSKICVTRMTAGYARKKRVSEQLDIKKTMHRFGFAIIIFIKYCVSKNTQQVITA